MANQFGHPDGAADDDLHSRRFLAPGEHRLRCLAEPPFRLTDDAKAIRLLVGEMGSGKSHCLRRIGNALSESEEVRFPESMPERPGVRVLQRLAPREDPYDLEFWSQLWRVALLTTAVSFIREHLHKLDPPNPKVLDEWPLAAQVLGNREFLQHPYSLFSAIEVDSRSDRYGYVEEREWLDIEERLPGLLRDLPIIALSLDNLDEFFDNDPKILAAFQAGLVRCILRLERNTSLTERLQTRATVRPVALNLLFRDVDRRLAILKSPRLADIYWTSSDLRQFLDFNLTEHAPSDLLAVQDLFIPERDARETISDYLLRHTTGAPRDLVILGNSLCKRYEAAGRALTESEIRLVTGELARQIGDAALTHCASDLAAIGAGRTSSSRPSPPTDGTADTHILTLSLRAWLSGLRTDVVPMNDLIAANADWVDELSRPFLLDELWRHRLVGVLDDPDEEVRFSRSFDEFFPYESQEVVLSSVLVESCQLQPARRRLCVAY